MTFDKTFPIAAVLMLQRYLSSSASQNATYPSHDHFLIQYSSVLPPCRCQITHFIVARGSKSLSYACDVNNISHEWWATTKFKVAQGVSNSQDLGFAGVIAIVGYYGYDLQGPHVRGKSVATI